MNRRARHIWLALIALVGAIVTLCARDPSPGQGSDNQGGYVIALLFFLVLLFIYVPVLMRSIAARFRRRSESNASPPDA
jgi:hypothetical protein